jgi:hypothetical protein
MQNTQVGMILRQSEHKGKQRHRKAGRKPIQTGHTDRQGSPASRKRRQAGRIHRQDKKTGRKHIQAGHTDRQGSQADMTRRQAGYTDSHNK